MTSKFLLPSAGLFTLFTMMGCGGELAASESPSQSGPSAALASGEAALTDSATQALMADLGRKIYFDTNLSEPAGQSCASCHDPSAGFADPDSSSPTSEGAVPGRFAGRNAPSAAYAQFAPPFRFNPLRGHPYVGGLFWDGRVSSLEAQAQLPLLNPLEMNNPDKASVVNKVRASGYASTFLKVFGPGAFDDVDQAYDNVSQAIAAFERTPAISLFTSKYDFYLQGKAKLTAQELRGLALFNDVERVDCADCHPSAGTRPLFTNFNYNNLGVPRNPRNGFYYVAPQFNALGSEWVDHGLGGVLGSATEDGKFKVPTLRNVALTAPYMHNGYFKDLRSVVVFYNSRDVAPFPPPEVDANVDHTIGDLGLSDQEVDDIVAFLNTLTDGYRPD